MEDEIEMLIVRYLLGLLSIQEHGLLDSRLACDQKAKTLFIEYSKIWSYARQHESDLMPDEIIISKRSIAESLKALMGDDQC